MALEAELWWPRDLFLSLCPSSLAPLREAGDVVTFFSFFSFLSVGWAPRTLSTSTSKNSFSRLCYGVTRLSGNTNATKCQLGLRRGLEGGAVDPEREQEGRLGRHGRSHQKPNSVPNDRGAALPTGFLPLGKLKQRVHSPSLRQV